MVKRNYDWKNGAELKSHSLIKLDIIDEYLREYVKVRCGLPQQSRFRLSLVDGFCGAGEYACGTSGSPILAIRALSDVVQSINLQRSVDGFQNIQFEFFLYFNDIDPHAVESLSSRVSLLTAELQETISNLSFTVVYSTGDFGQNLRAIAQKILDSKVRNTIFNLDQYGHSNVTESQLEFALSLTKSSEVFLTFSIQSFLAFISPEKILTTENRGLFEGKISEISLHKSKKEWLAAVELLVFEEFNSFASFVSPFSINNSTGWEYWLVHFANSYRARQVYNDILHRKKSSQAHVGRSGLQMLRYSSIDETNLYLFDKSSREQAQDELLDDVPRFITDTSKHREMSVESFYNRSYNHTPAHSDDLNEALIKSDDIEVLTSKGGKRRKSQMIKRSDLIRLAPQRTFSF